jgi:hypothetical protein
LGAAQINRNNTRGLGNHFPSQDGKSFAADRLFTSQEVAESWYLEKSEEESEEGLDEDMMAYVHQAEEILKEGAKLLQKHQTMKTEVPYGDMVSSHEYAKSSDPHKHNTVKQEPTQLPPPGPSGVSSQTSTHAPHPHYHCSSPATWDWEYLDK